MGTSRSLLGSVELTASSFSVAEDTALPSAKSFLLFYVADGTDPSSLEISDLNGSVEALDFYAEDLNLVTLRGA